MRDFNILCAYITKSKFSITLTINYYDNTYVHYSVYIHYYYTWKKEHSTYRCIRFGKLH